MVTKIGFHVENNIQNRFIPETSVCVRKYVKQIPDQRSFLFRPPVVDPKRKLAMWGSNIKFPTPPP